MAFKRSGVRLPLAPPKSRSNKNGCSFRVQYRSLNTCRGCRARAASRRNRFLSIIVASSAPARTQAAQARGDEAQIVEDACEALTTAERAVERRHGAGEARIVVAHPGAQHQTVQQRQSL